MPAVVQEAIVTKSLSNGIRAHLDCINNSPDGSVKMIGSHFDGNRFGYTTIAIVDPIVMDLHIIPMAWQA